jgi:hypothetical protein
MPTLIQKPIEDIVEYFKPEEEVFVVGCGNYAAKCHAGGEVETKGMVERLERRELRLQDGPALTVEKVSVSSRRPERY